MSSSSGRVKQIPDSLVDAFVDDYAVLSRSVIRDVLVRTGGRAKLAVASLDRIERVAHALKREFHEFALDAIVLALQNNAFKLKRTVDELTALRSVARLQQKHPRVAIDVINTIWNKCNKDYDATDREIAALIAQLERQTLKKSASRPKSTQFDRPPLSIPPLQLDNLHQQQQQQQQQQPRSGRAAPYGSLGRQSAASQSAGSLRDAILATHTSPPPLSPHATASSGSAVRGIFGDDDDDLEKIDFDRDLGAIAAGYTASANRMQARALFDYVGDRDDKLTFKKGQIIDLTEAGDTAWWRGTLGGSGPSRRFPAAYVRLMTKDIRATALYAFHDNSRAEHLDFDAGDELVLLNKIPGSAWWEALHIKTNRCGIVPLNFTSIAQGKEEFDRLNAQA